MTEPILPPAPTDDEIDLIALAKKLYLGRILLIKTVAVFAVLGVLVALLSPKQYTATSTIVSQLGGDSNTKLSGVVVPIV